MASIASAGWWTYATSRVRSHIDHRDAVRPAMNVTPVSDHELLVELTAAPTAYAYFVHLSVPHDATPLSDNYFDLEPGERRTIAITNPLGPLAASDVTLAAP